MRRACLLVEGERGRQTALVDWLATNLVDSLVNEVGAVTRTQRDEKICLQLSSGCPHLQANLCVALWPIQLYNAVWRTDLGEGITGGIFLSL